ncbi:MAG: hypothetical protein R2746_04770 [Acidimicrobiales bacterium]
MLQALGRWPPTPESTWSPPTGSCSQRRARASRGLLSRKGFPESYDVRRLLELLRQVKSGSRRCAPTYSHLVYDVQAAEHGAVIRRLTS